MSLLSIIIYVVVLSSIISSIKKKANPKNVSRPNVPRVHSRDEIKSVDEIYGKDKSENPYRMSTFFGTDKSARRETYSESTPSSYSRTTGSKATGSSVSSVPSSMTSKKNVTTQIKHNKAHSKYNKEAERESLQPDTTEKKEKSTTQYLQEKALQDSREHALEKKKDELENRKIYGNINYAKRLVLGDAVPKGMKLVYCEYCRAENLVPVNDSKERYNCYFCREKL